MHQQARRPSLYKDGSFAIGNGEGGGIMTSIAHYYISLLSGMRNIDDRDHLVGQLTSGEDAICCQPSVPAFDLSRNVYTMENVQNIKLPKK